MIDFERQKLPYAEASKIIDNYDQKTDAEFRKVAEQWASFNVNENDFDPIYKSIREEIVSVFRKSLNDADNKVTYLLDLNVGIALYNLMNKETGFSIINANDDDIWRYISIKVMPDLTFIRYPNLESDVDIIKEKNPGFYVKVDTEKGSLRLKKKRFYSATRRIWLKTLWWYIYLSWQGDSEKTYEALKNNTINSIGHLIERTGNGYRVELYREMQRQYALLPIKRDKIFTSAAKLNLVKCVTVEPALTDGGEKQYVKDLFDEVLKSKVGELDAEG